MDPNETLRRLRACTDEDDPFAPAELLTNMQELFRGLDEWLSKGGFLPDAWRQEPKPGSPEQAALVRRLAEPLGPPDPAGVELPGIVSVETNDDGDYVVGIRDGE